MSWRGVNGSECRSTDGVLGSNDGTTWDVLAGREDDSVVGFTSDDLSGDDRHVRLAVSSVTNDHNGNAAHWSAGRVEVQVFGDDTSQTAVGALQAVIEAASLGDTAGFSRGSRRGP